MLERRSWLGYGWALSIAMACTVIAWALSPPFNLVNVVMVYMLGVVFMALRHERGAAVLTAMLCIATFDYLFVPPRGSFTVEDAQYLCTFLIMVVVALTISHLVRSVRAQARAQ